MARLASLRRGLFSVLLLVAACAPTPKRLGYPSEWIPSPNFNERRPSYVILHHTSDDAAEQALRTLTDPVREVSSHYLVSRNGKIYQLVDERYRAWHAGQARWGTDADLNSSSIGIELDNNGDEPFPPEQIESLLGLLEDIKTRYRIPTGNFIGHADIAPGRKVDPSAWFPWRLLAQRGFGLWCDPPYPASPPAFDVEVGLRALGYDMSRPDAAVRAFKLHFVQRNMEAVLTSDERDLLFCLLQGRAEMPSTEGHTPEPMPSM